MIIGIDPAIDYAFKKIFATEENKESLRRLIDAILQEKGEKKIVELELVNPFHAQDFKQDKLSIVDVRAKSEQGEWFIIEIQIMMNDYYPKRLLYYWAKTYQSQLTKGVQYDQLKKTTIISISKNDLPLPTVSYLNNFRVVCVEDKKTVFCEDLDIYTIELSKFIVQDRDVSSSVERWVYFLKNGENLDDENLPKCLEGAEMQQAISELKKMSLDEKEREQYEARRLAMIDAETREGYSYRKGIKEGKIEGIKEGEIKGKIEGIKEGKIEGKIEGIKEGEIKGKIEGIETLLELRFGAGGLRSVEYIRSIKNLEKLNRIFLLAGNAPNIEAFESGLENRGA